MYIEENNSIFKKYNIGQKQIKLKETPQQTAQQKPHQDQKKKIIIGLTALAAVGAAGIAIAYGIKKGQLPKTLKNIKFDRGIAKTRTGKLFTGEIKDTLKNGDLIHLTYKDGVIQSSIREGSKNLSKTYSYDNGGILTKITTQKDGNIIEFIKTKYGHIIKENSQLQKAYLKRGGQDTVAYFRNGKPTAVKDFYDGVKKFEHYYEYDQNGKLSKITYYNDRMNYKVANFEDNKITIKYPRTSYDSEEVTRTITKGGNQPYGANLSVIEERQFEEGTTRQYFKDGKLIYKDRTTGHTVDNSCRVLGDYSFERVRTEGGFDTRVVYDYSQNPSPKGTVERVYQSGARDRLLSGGGFNSSSMEMEQLGRNGETLGFIKSEYQSKDSAHHVCHGIVNRTDNVKITRFDANHNPISSYNTTNSYSDWSNYDWD